MVSARRQQAHALEALHGARAELEGPAGEERIVVFSPAGALVLEYDPTRGRTVVHAPDGDLEIAAPNGSLALRGKKGVEIEGARLTARSAEADLDVGTIRIRAKTLETAIDRLDHTLGVAEVRAERLIERVKNAYREVEELSQTHAGRIRWIARETFQLLGRRTILKAEEDLKLKGDKIHLG